jgi:small multidrug resistance pump
MGALLLTLAVLFNSVANGILKQASSIREFSKDKIVLLLLGLFVGFVNTVCYIKALEKIDLGVAFPVWSAASIVLIAGISYYFFKEQLSARQMVGLVTICIGMILLLKYP